MYNVTYNAQRPFTESISWVNTRISIISLPPWRGFVTDCLCTLMSMSGDVLSSVFWVLFVSRRLSKSMSIVTVSVKSCLSKSLVNLSCLSWKSLLLSILSCAVLSKSSFCLTSYLSRVWNVSKLSLLSICLSLRSIRSGSTRKKHSLPSSRQS